MPVKFWHVLCHKCTWYFLATPQSSKSTYAQCLWISCVLSLRLILHELGISLPHQVGCSKVKNAYIKGEYYSICDDYGVDANKTWMHGDWTITDYAIFGHEVKATERYPPDYLTRWIITQSKGFTKKDVEKISGSVSAYVCLVLTSQVQARSSIVGNCLQWMLNKPLKICSRH